MASTLSVRVTQDDIDQGQPGKLCYCAIALALTRTYGGEWMVGGGVAEQRTGNMLVRSLLTSSRALRFMRRFDRDKAKCKPQTFRLEVVADG